MSTNGCTSGLALEPIEACPLTLTWSPTRVGVLLDDVQIRHDGARGILVLPIRGNAESVVSQDQKAIILTEETTHVIGSDDVTTASRSSEAEPVSQKTEKSTKSQTRTVANAASALDGLKITSFSSTRAIVNGPGGSRLIFNNEQVMLGGVVWDVNIQGNGIEFSNGKDRVLLLFDRSLSSLNRISGQSVSSAASSSADSEE